MTNRSLKRIVAVLLLAFVVVAIGVGWFVTRAPASPFDDVADTAVPSAEQLRHGEYVARLADCVACHSTPSGAPFAGGLEMATPMGSIFATNITPDQATGIGRYRLADFDRALRHGVAMDGHRLYPAMPYPSYAKLNDDDVRALYAYFMHGVRPVLQENKRSEIRWPLNMRWPLALWNAVFTPADVYQTKAPNDDAWNRGAYIVQGPGHCGSCHTPRGSAMNELAFDESSALYLSGTVLDGWYAPSLRGDVHAGLGRWSDDDIFRFLRNGRNRHAVVFGSMTDVVNNSTQYMTDDDLHAVARYLKSLGGNPESDRAPWQYDPNSNSNLALDRRLNVAGAQTYVARCSACHGQDGRGQAPWIPPLVGGASSLAKQSESSINVTLNGSGRVVTNGMPDAYRMPPFRKQLSDREIADVLTFVRTSWGNDGGAVKADDVKYLRGRTNPASSNVIVLQMR